MTRRLLGSLLFCATLASGVASAEACGDKFLVCTATLRADQLNYALAKASILIYENASSESAKALADPDLRATLVKAGHSVTVAEDTDTLGNELTTGKYDVVLAALSDALNLKGSLALERSSPMLLPVLYFPTRSSASEARDAFAYVLERPGKRSRILEVIDDALGTR